MSVMAIMLALVAVLFFLGIGGVYLLLSFIGRMTEPKEQDDGEEVARCDPSSACSALMMGI